LEPVAWIINAGVVRFMLRSSLSACHPREGGDP